MVLIGDLKNLEWNYFCLHVIDVRKYNQTHSWDMQSSLASVIEEPICK